MRDGHSGGIIEYPAAIVEYENGAIASVPVKNIFFADTQKVMCNLAVKESKWKSKAEKLMAEYD